MSTDYFNPVTYQTRQAVTTPITMPQPLNTTIPTDTNGNPIAGAAATQVFAGAPGAASRAFLASQIGLLPERTATQMGIARNNAKDASRGFGGINWRKDDPATPNVDESLMVDYQPDAMGKNERSAVINARAAAASRGIISSSESDQMVGAGLQRVSEQARAVVNQYSGQISTIAAGADASAVAIIGQITTTYGQDAAWDAQRVLNEQTAIDSKALIEATKAQTAALTAAPAAKTGPTGTVLWTGSINPNPKTLNDQFGPGTYRVVKSTVNGKPHYVVVTL
jgi:hypothetical protein